MEKMTLGTHEFWRNPTNCTEPKERKITSIVPTYTSVVYFSWGMKIAGQEIVLSWDWMPSDEFAEFQDILAENVQKTFVPRSDVSGEYYNVEVLSVEGDLLKSSLWDAPWRKEVEVSLVIISEGT